MDAMAAHAAAAATPGGLLFLLEALRQSSCLRSLLSAQLPSHLRRAAMEGERAADGAAKLGASPQKPAPPSLNCGRASVTHAARSELPSSLLFHLLAPKAAPAPPAGSLPPCRDASCRLLRPPCPYPLDKHRRRRCRLPQALLACTLNFLRRPLFAAAVAAGLRRARDGLATASIRVKGVVVSYGPAPSNLVEAWRRVADSGELPDAAALDALCCFTLARWGRQTLGEKIAQLEAW